MRKGEHFPFWIKVVRTKIKPDIGLVMWVFWEVPQGPLGYGVTTLIYMLISVGGITAYGLCVDLISETTFPLPESTGLAISNIVAGPLF